MIGDEFDAGLSEHRLGGLKSQTRVIWYLHHQRFSPPNVFSVWFDEHSQSIVNAFDR